MLLGGTVTGPYSDIRDWEQILIRSGFKAITAPFTCRTAEKEIRAFLDVIAEHQVRIAEIGVWKNIMDPDPGKAADAMAYAKGQLALADRLGIPCCVNIAGTSGLAGWDAADVSNYTQEAYEKIIRTVREILDDVQPARAFYCLEPMPWMVPDGPDEYLQLLEDVDRPRFSVHMDFVNMINSPRRYLNAERFIEDCFRKLGPYIRSTHIKGTRMHPTNLTTILEECSPGEGSLDFAAVLRIMDRYLPEDAPVLLEHMQTEEEYCRSMEYLKKIAETEGIPV